MAELPDENAPPAQTPERQEPAAKAPRDKKGRADRKGAKGKKGKKGAEATSGVSVAGHPRAAAAVRRAKGFGGLAGFGLAALLSHQAGLSIDQVVERALIAGVAGYLLAWACAVSVWRHIVLAQATALADRIQQERSSRAAIPLAAAPDAPSAPPDETAPEPTAAVGQGAG